MPRRKFHKLKALLYEMGIDQRYIARYTGKSLTYISERMTGKQPFNTFDMDKIGGSLLKIPREQYHLYFWDCVKYSDKEETNHE